jgi:hypothetical protein
MAGADMSALITCHEQVYVLVKGHPAKLAQPLDDVQPWEHSGNVVHPTEAAVSALQPPIRSFSRLGDPILDPFSASGSTLVAAALSGKYYITENLHKTVAFGDANSAPFSSIYCGAPPKSKDRPYAPTQAALNEEPSQRLANVSAVGAVLLRGDGRGGLPVMCQCATHHCCGTGLVHGIRKGY